MTSKEKKDIVLREVVKPELKRAGYRTKGNNYISMQNGCCIAICISSSRFNSNSMGFAFGFDIFFLQGDYSEERLKNWNDSSRDAIREFLLLPDCGFLHPYHKPLGYTIDGYKDYKPQDMDVEDIKNRIGDDLRRYILPELAEIKCYEDWERRRQEWDERANSKRVCLLRFFNHAHNYNQIQSNAPHLLDIRQKNRITAQEIKENYPLYQQIRELSALPNKNNWAFILAALTAEGTSG